MSNIKTPTVLAFERKLDPSDALFYAGNWDNVTNSNQWRPITIREKAIRGTISNRLTKDKDKDPAKLDAKIDQPNLQRVDVATLPNDCDTLKIAFSLRILGNVGLPSACNCAEYQKKLLQTVKQYTQENGFKELAMRYAYNIANARFLWRNRLSAEEVVVNVSHIVSRETKQTWQFNASQLSLRHFDSEHYQSALTELADVIENALWNESSFALLKIEAFARMGVGQEVFPSQELVLNSNNKKKDSKSKLLYAIDKIAAMHSQKIGNALRTIDTWYPIEENSIGPIAVEPYGSVTSQGKAYRQPKQKSDFYSLFDDWILKDKVPNIENQHYVLATLVRGGVFGASAKE